MENFRKLFTKSTTLVIALFAVALVATGCGSSSSSSGGGGGGIGVSGNVINAAGGDGGGTGGNGGDGACGSSSCYDIDLAGSSDNDAYMTYVTTSGNIKSNFTATAIPSTTIVGGQVAAVVSGSTGSGLKANLGEEALVIEADTTLAVLGAEPTTGVAYLVASDNTVYISNGDGSLGGTLNDGDAEATGIYVKNGVTLTLELNYTSYAQITVLNDIENHGTIASDEQTATQMGGLEFYLNTYYGGSNSAINTAGTKDAQSGGDVYIYPDYSYYDAGDVDTSGADSTLTNAADGGDYYVGTYFHIETTGDIDVSGGNSTLGGGGDSGWFEFYVDEGHMWNSADINSNAGNGTTYGGYSECGYYYHDGDYASEFKNQGDILCNGGDGGTGDGGDGYWFAVNSLYGGGIYSSGDIEITGGDTASATADAGDVQYGIDLYIYDGNSSWDEDDVKGGPIQIGGNIIMTGGNTPASAAGTGDGGAGGGIFIEFDADAYIDNWADFYTFDISKVSKSHILFAGYTDVIATGGDGQYPGDGGSYYIENEEASADFTSYRESGPVVQQADVDLSGGNNNGTNVGVGGSGGDVDFETGYDYQAETIYATVINTGDIVSRGGASYNDTSRADGGDVDIVAISGVTNSGDIDVSGGTDTVNDDGTDGYGGDAGDVYLQAEAGAIVNSGDVTGNGGDGEYSGGDGSYVELYALETSNTGDVDVDGGDSEVALSGSAGGDAGCVAIYSYLATSSSVNKGTLSGTSGAGETDGDGPDMMVDGNHVVGDTSNCSW